MLDNDQLRDYLDHNNYRRVLKISRTPDFDEFIKNAGLVLLAILFIGLTGFVIFYLMDFLPMIINP